MRISADSPALKLAQDRQPNEDAFRYYRRLSRVRKLVESRLGNPVSLKEAARAACNEATYFSKFFRAKTGVPYRWWVNDLRIRAPQNLLRRDNACVYEVANRLGFSDPSHFGRVFRRHTGSTPTEFREGT